MNEVGFLDIVEELRRQPRLVIDAYCSGEGAHPGQFGEWFCLNPTRNDTRVGSFKIDTRGHRIGRWYDFATKESGDVFDLICKIENQGKVHALNIAKQLLGITDFDPGTKKRLANRRAKAEAERQVERERDAQRRQKREGWGRALWHAAEPDIRGTPVERYLIGRAIDIGQLPRTPRALRFHPACKYTRTDEWGEMHEAELPAMIAAVNHRDGTVMGAHRTYLAEHPDGTVTKAGVPDPKKILGSVRGGAIRVWSGLGPRGGKPVPLARVPEGSRVYVTEGIEDALAAALMKPDARVIAAVSLDNMGRIALPKAVSEVVLCADNDEGEQAQYVLARSIEAHQKAGRIVRVWRSLWGKDVNDALMAAGGAA